MKKAELFLNIIWGVESCICPDEVIAVAVDEKERIAYAAVKHTRDGASYRTGDVFAIIAPYYPNAADGEIVTSDDMDDDGTGSVHTNCPPEILNLLSPTTKEFSLQWREACAKKAKRVKRVKLIYFDGRYLF